MNSLDYVLIFSLFMSVGVGAWRGVVKELFSLVAWLASIISATLFTDTLSHFLMHWFKDPVFTSLLSFFLIFMTVLIIGQVIKHLMHNAVTFSGMGLINRMMGSGFGLVRGLLGTMVLVLFLTVLPVTDDLLIDGSVIAGIYEVPVRVMRDWLPEQWHDQTFLTTLKQYQVLWR